MGDQESIERIVESHDYTSQVARYSVQVGWKPRVLGQDLLGYSYQLEISVTSLEGREQKKAVFNGFLLKGELDPIEQTYHVLLEGQEEMPFGIEKRCVAQRIANFRGWDKDPDWINWFSEKSPFEKLYGEVRGVEVNLMDVLATSLVEYKSP